MPSPASPVVWIQPQAPPKPALGAACNGCGLCCLLEPCPVGMALSRRRTGACVQLRWDAPNSRYQCGLLWPAPARASKRSGLWQWLLRRWIGAGVGCDAQVQATPALLPNE